MNDENAKEGRYTININETDSLSSLWTDTITISGTGGATGATGSTLNTYGSYTIPTTPYYSNYSSITGPNTTWGSSDSSIQVNGDAAFEGDIKWKGRSLGKLLEKIEDRLAIISEPDPEKLEKYAALKKAYDHYKLLEKLIGEE
jgi:hypothetical protein